MATFVAMMFLLFVLYTFFVSSGAFAKLFGHTQLRRPAWVQRITDVVGIDCNLAVAGLLQDTLIPSLPWQWVEWASLHIRHALALRLSSVLGTVTLILSPFLILFAWWLIRQTRLRQLDYTAFGDEPAELFFVSLSLPLLTYAVVVPVLSPHARVHWTAARGEDAAFQVPNRSWPWWRVLLGLVTTLVALGPIIYRTTVRFHCLTDQRSALHAFTVSPVDCSALLDMLEGATKPPVPGDGLTSTPQSDWELFASETVVNGEDPPPPENTTGLSPARVVTLILWIPILILALVAIVSGQDASLPSIDPRLVEAALQGIWRVVKTLCLFAWRIGRAVLVASFPFHFLEHVTSPLGIFMLTVMVCAVLVDLRFHRLNRGSRIRMIRTGFAAFATYYLMWLSVRLVYSVSAGVLELAPWLHRAIVHSAALSLVPYAIVTIINIVGGREFERRISSSSATVQRLRILRRLLVHTFLLSILGAALDYDLQNRVDILKAFPLSTIAFPAILVAGFVVLFSIAAAIQMIHTTAIATGHRTFALTDAGQLPLEIDELPRWFAASPQATTNPLAEYATL